MWFFNWIHNNSLYNNNNDCKTQEEKKQAKKKNKKKRRINGFEGDSFFYNLFFKNGKDKQGVYRMVSSQSM